MQDLVGIGVADAVDDRRIGQRALECAILRAQRADECVEIAGEDVNAAAIDRLQRFASLYDGERCAPFRAGLGEHERTLWKIECGQRVAPAELRPARAPVEAARD